MLSIMKKDDGFWISLDTGTVQGLFHLGFPKSGICLKVLEDSVGEYKKIKKTDSKKKGK